MSGARAQDCFLPVYAHCLLSLIHIPPPLNTTTTHCPASPYHAYLWANFRDELLPAQAFPEHHTLSISVPFTHLSFFLISLAASQLSKWSIETRKRTVFGSLSEQGFAFSAVTALLSPAAPTVLAVRHASKKTGGSSKNLGGKSRGKHYGIKKMEGEGVPSLLFSSRSPQCCPAPSQKSRNATQGPHSPVSLQFTVALIPTWEERGPQGVAVS